MGCSLVLFQRALTTRRVCRISNVITLQLGITLMNLSTWPTGHKVPLNMKVQALISTQAQTGLDQAPAIDLQCIDDMEMGVGHPPEDVQTMADEPAEG